MKVGILGAGHIAEKMARTLGQMAQNAICPDSHELCYAVASRDLNKAATFARTFGMAKAFGSYEQMLEDPDLDLVYVATPHSLHHEHVRMCLEHGKHVLCEKAFMVTLAEAEDVIKLARGKGLLVAEAAWPRYTPFSVRIKQLLDEGVIGEPMSLSATMGYPISGVPRIIRPELGGGALLDLGVYCIHFARMCFGGDIAKVHSVATLSDTGVDLQNSVTLVYGNGRMAQLHSSAQACTERRGIINGDKASMIIDNISNPLEAWVYNRAHELIGHYKSEPQLTGFEYEVMACQRAIAKSCVELAELPHEEILEVMKLMDALRTEWGVKYL